MNIAHRDIKLENILCSVPDISDDNCIFKLGDFGFAKRSERNNLMESPCCTYAYVCPEILSHERYDKSCDLWAIGVVMYILLCGYPPFYSMQGLPFSPGMKNRITVGLYAFPPEEWDKISNSSIYFLKLFKQINVAKNEIRHLLKTDPASRTNIQELMSSSFLQQNSQLKSLPEVPSDASLSSWEGAYNEDAPDSAFGSCAGDENCVCCSDDETRHSLTIECEDNPRKIEYFNTIIFLVEFSFSRSLKSSKNLATEFKNSHAFSALNFPTSEVSKKRPYNIQEEVGRALDMIRLGGNNCYIKSLKVASGNRLLSRRRAATSVAIESLAQKV